MAFENDPDVHIDSDTPTPTSLDQPDPADQALTLEVTIALPDHIAPFGIVEYVNLPPQLPFMLSAGDEQMGVLIGAGLRKALAEKVESLTITLIGVLALHGATGNPVDGEEFMKWRQEQLNALAGGQHAPDVDITRDPLTGDHAEEMN